MNENKHKSCHSSSENILIEQSCNSSVTPKPTCNRRLLFCSWLLFRCTTTTTKRHSNCNGLSQTNFTKTKASRINLQREIKKTRGLTVQFGPDASKAALQQRPTFCAWSLRRWVWTIFILQVLQLSCSSLICGKSQCLETGNQFGFTEYNCGLLQNAIQQPQFCLFTDLLVLVGYHLIAY